MDGKCSHIGRQSLYMAYKDLQEMVQWHFFFKKVEGEEKVVEIFYMKNESGRWIERLEFFSLWKKNMIEFFREHGINLAAYIWKEEILH